MGKWASTIGFKTVSAVIEVFGKDLVHRSINMSSPWVENRRLFLGHFGALISFSCIAISADVWGQDTGDRLRFAPESDGGGFAFDTGLLSGKLRQQGKPIGMTPLHY